MDLRERDKNKQNYETRKGTKSVVEFLLEKVPQKGLVK